MSDEELYELIEQVSKKCEYQYKNSAIPCLRCPMNGDGCVWKRLMRELWCVPMLIDLDKVKEIINE